MGNSDQWTVDSGQWKVDCGLWTVKQAGERQGNLPKWVCQDLAKS